MERVNREILVETWCAFGVSAIATIATTVFILSVVKKKCATQPQSKYSNPAHMRGIAAKKEHKIFVYCGIICLATFLVRALISTIVFSVLIAQNKHETNKPNTALLISWTFYGFGLWLMLVSFVFRIQFTFKGTHLEYSPVIIKVLYVLLVITFIECILIGVMNMFPPLWGTVLIIAYVTLVSHFLFSILLSYLLFSKIFETMQHRLRERRSVANATEAHAGDAQEMTTLHEADDGKSPSSSNQISLNSIKAVTRYALLMFLGIVSTYILNVLVIIDMEYQWSINYHILTWAQVFMAIDLMVNATTVYLLFQYNSSKYYSICKICHVGCERCCVEIIYCYSKRAKKHANSSKQEFATLILTAEDDTAVL